MKIVKDNQLKSKVKFDRDLLEAVPDCFHYVQNFKLHQVIFLNDLNCQVIHSSIARSSDSVLVT